jgi:hypothetical protein
VKEERERDIFTTWLVLARGRSSGSFRFLEETHMRKDIVLKCMMLHKIIKRMSIQGDIFLKTYKNVTCVNGIFYKCCATCLNDHVVVARHILFTSRTGRRIFPWSDDLCPVGPEVSGGDTAMPCQQGTAPVNKFQYPFRIRENCYHIREMMATVPLFKLECRSPDGQMSHI